MSRSPKVSSFAYKTALFVAFTGLTFANFANVSFAQGQYQTILQQGDPAGTNGFIRDFTGVHLNNAGQIFLEASSITGTTGGSSDDNALFLYSGSSLFEIAREGSPAPSNGNFRFLNFPQLNNNGQSLFSSTGMTGTSGGSADDSGIFLYDGSNVIEIAREGSAAPTNGNYGNLGELQLNNAGQVAFESTSMTGTLGGFADDNGVFLHNGISIQQLAREGSAAPTNGNYGSFGEVQLNNTGQVAFESITMTGTSGGTANDNALFLHNGSGVVEFAREGDAAGSNGNFGGFTDLQMNDSGHIAFEAFGMSGTTGGTSDDNGVFLYNNNNIQEIVREGDAAFGNGSFGGFSFLQLNSADQIAFTSSLNATGGGASDNQGVYLYDGANLLEAAREGSSAPNDGKYGSFSLMQLNDGGQVAFESISMQGTSGGTANDNAAFISDGIETIEIRREGDLVDGLTTTGIESLSLNDYGQVALELGISTGGDLIELWTPDLRWRNNVDGSWNDKGNWTLSINPNVVHDVYLDSDADVTISGPSNASVRTLDVGGGNGLVTLDMAGGGSLTTSNGLNVRSTGTLTGTGSINGSVINDGTIVAKNLTFNSGLTNNTGVVEGNGRIAGGTLTNNSSGSIRAGTGDVLRIDNSLTKNSGVIETIGGEMRFANNVQNNSGTGFITARDATMRFDGGLNNEGSLGISIGTSDIFGKILNTGVINISGGAVATFYDDVAQNGVMQVVSVGNTTSAAVFFGELSGNLAVGGGDVFALGDLRPGFSPASVLMDGNLFLGVSTESVFELEGLDVGEFDQLIVTGDLGLAGQLTVDLLSGFELATNQEFMIADVGGSLFGQFSGLSEGGLVGNYGGTDLFITYGGGDGNDVALFSAVPEPSSVAICFMAALGLISRRRQRTA